MPTVKKVTEGNFKKYRMVYVCGLGATGSLGLTHYYRPDVANPYELKKKETFAKSFRRVQQFSANDKIVDVACGYGFSVVAAEIEDSNHTALGFGLNTHSQLGYQCSRPGFPLEVVASPAKIWLPTKTPITKVSCGRSHSLFLSRSGQVFALGNNSFGQCGRPIQEKEEYFASKKVNQLVDLPTNIKQIECGQDHSLFLTDTGELYSCGWGADGQTGLGHFENQFKPSKVRGDIEGVEIVKVSTRADTVLALDKSGNVFGWGNSEYAQFRVLANNESEQFNSPRNLNLPSEIGRIVDIAAGGTMCAILNNKGQVFVWGFGILGKGPNVDQSSKPTLLPETLFGMNVYSPDVKVEKIYAGLSQFAAINSRGDLYAWGRNRGNLLGVRHESDQFFPMRIDTNMASVKKISIGVDHSCAIVEKVC